MAKTVNKILQAIILLFFDVANVIFCDETTADVVLRPVTSNEEFIQWLRSENHLRSDTIEEVLRKVDILNYVPHDSFFFLLDVQTDVKYGAFMENPSLILTYLKLIESHLKSNSKVLEIGSGTGYLTHLMGELMNGTGQIIGVEHVPDLVNASIQNILHSNPDLLLNGHIKFVVADGRRGYAKKSPYDLILMSGSTPHLSSSLVDQLKPGGRLVLSLGDADSVQTLCTLDKYENGTLQKTIIQRGSFGHLQDRDEQMGIWMNGTSKSESSAKQRSELQNLFAELGRQEAVLEPKEKIKDMFENAKLARVEKEVQSYERDAKGVELFGDDDARPDLPPALEEVMHELRTPPTKKTRKKKVTTTTENLLMWK